MSAPESAHFFTCTPVSHEVKKDSPELSKSLAHALCSISGKSHEHMLAQHACVVISSPVLEQSLMIELMVQGLIHLPCLSDCSELHRADAVPDGPKCLLHTCQNCWQP